MIYPFGRDHIAHEIERFGETWSLTPRERDVMRLIAQGTTRIKDVATHLELSPNTVNNHINSIFTKTKTRSKSELLTRLLSELTDELMRHRVYHRSPRVLFCSAPGHAERFVEVLEQRGCRVHVVHDPLLALEMIVKEPVNFLLLDMDEQRFDLEDYFKRMSEPLLSWTKVAVLASTVSDETRASVMNAGAIDLLQKPYDADRLYRCLMAYYTENSESLAQFEDEILRAESKGICTVALSPQNAGRGGVFITTDELRSSLRSPLGVGDRLDLKLRLPREQESVAMPGQVMWLRESAVLGRPAGVGVRLIPIQLFDRERLARFHRDHGIRSFIPFGA